MTAEERAKILRGVELMYSSTNDTGEIIARPFRMCGYVPMNIPILCGILLAPPTMKWTAFFQWMNQSYNASMNYGNKNSTCEYTNTDLLKGYAAAASSSVAVALTLRALTSGVTKTATGKKLLLMNALIGGVAGGAASGINAYLMR